MRLAATYISALFLMALLCTTAHAATWELKTVPLPEKSSEGELRAVSCTSTSFCAAVGDSWNGAIWGADGAEWKEGSWLAAKIEANPKPGTKNGDLLGVSCWKAMKCRAVGTYGLEEKGEGLGRSLVEGRNSEGAWEKIPSPYPASGKDDEFLGISCPTGESCLATGWYINGEGLGAIFASEWETEKWGLLSPIANPGNRGGGNLAGVSCIEAGVCVAAGGWGRESEGKVISQAGSETWQSEGKKWAAVEAEEPLTAKLAWFNGISCTSATFCMAVGGWNEGAGGAFALADVWNGTKWTVVLSSGGPPGAKSGVFTAVSCIAEECHAVGGATNSEGKEVTLSYLWKAKKWEFQTTPNPAGAKASFLKGVSCTASEVCTAVGGYKNSSNVLLPLAEVL